MNFPFYIGRRYLFSKKSHNAINVISLISVCGIAVATIALVCTLSVFNGFEGLVTKLFSAYDPDLLVTPATGKVFRADAPEVKKALLTDGIEAVAQTLEENALLRYGDKQAPVLVKGVSDNFRQVADMQKVMLAGNFAFKQGDIEYGVMGVGLASKLNAHREFVTPMEIYAPIRNAKINLANPSGAFTQTYIYLNGVFSLNNQKADESLLIVSLDIARKAFLYEGNQVSALAVKIKDGASSKIVREHLKAVLGEKYLVKDRFEQQESTFRIMQIEKWVTFFILAFIAVIAVFNVIGSLTMLILEKQGDIATLRSLGADSSTIAGIFLVEGWLISFIGASAGLVLGLALCLIQQHFGLLKLSNTPGAFLVDAYPVKVEAGDLLLIFSCVVSIGFLAVVLPIRNLRKKLRESR